MKTCNQTEQSKVKLFVVLWKIFKTLYSTQLFKIWTLFFRDNVTGHTLVALGKGRRVPELCSRGSDCSRFAAAVEHVLARVFARVLPCGMPFGDEKPHGMPFEAIPLSPSHVGCERKRKSCGVTSEVKSANSRIFGKKGSRVVRPPQREKHNKMSLKCVYKQLQ